MGATTRKAARGAVRKEGKRRMGSDKRFADALHEAIMEEEISIREFARRCVKRTGWGSHTTVNALLHARLEPSIEAMEACARTLNLKPEHFAEYRLAMARQQLDPRVVGLETALRNLEAAPRLLR